MAILVYFEKIREDNQEVEYLFGYPEKDRRLVIDKESQEGRSLDGKQDLYYRKAFVKIVMAHREIASWPKMGSYAA